MAGRIAPQAAAVAMYVHVFRVEEGLGNACVLEFPDASCAVVDWGTQSKDALEQLFRIARKGRLRFIAASHAHEDHTLGLELLLRECHRRKIHVDQFVYPASTLNRRNACLTNARKAALKCKIEMSAVAVDTFLAPEGERKPPYLAWADDRSWEVRVLSPSLVGVAKSEMQALAGEVVPGNETSLVILFRFLKQSAIPGAARVLLPGDATPATLQLARKTGNDFSGLAIDNQAMVVPHHGSRHNLPAWLRAYSHGVVTVSGPTDSPSHPSPEVLKLLTQWTSPDSGSRFVCTSYALCCAKRFGGRAGDDSLSLVAKGSCFGHIVIRVPESEQARLERSSHRGQARRKFGYCGNGNE